MPYLVNLTSACVVALILPCFALADESNDLESLLRENTYSIVLENGALTGPGAELIMEAAAGTQFVALGEEHYNFHIPGITTALFQALHDQEGYRYFMTEQDPVMMASFSAPPVRGNEEAIISLVQTYPAGVTFNSDQELQMLADIGRISEAEENVIWGCDQASGVTHILDQLLEEPIGDSAVDAVQAFRIESAENEAVRDYSKGHYMFDVSTEDLERLKVDVDPATGSRADWLLDVVINSSRIFGFYKNGSNGILPGYYENNRYREEHLKDLCLARYRAAESEQPMPRVLMKFGSWHLYEGLSPTRVHTIGAFFSNVARFNGEEFLSIHFKSRPEDPEENMKEIAFIWPFVRDLDPGEFAVVDLRPFRRRPNRVLVEKTQGEEWVQASKERFVRLVYGYDLIFFVGATRAATFEAISLPD
jgi:hypothetical protein